jgi:hypothetical protein
MIQSRRRRGGNTWFCLLVLLFQGFAVATDGEGPEAALAARTRIQEIVDDFIVRLTLDAKVAISVVPKNPLMMSVQVDDSRTGFLMSLDEDFVSELTDSELQAAIAHELGHVWIFTHHPYLQTEALANQIAQRVVSRDDLVQVYEKVWSRLGTKGDLARFVGQ